MHPKSDALRAGCFDRPADPRRLLARRNRCAKAAAALFCVGASTVLFLCLRGLRPPGLAVPAFLAATSLLFASASAALFAHVAHLQLPDADHGEDEDGRGPGGGFEEPPDPPSGEGLEVDWARFERRFRAYCERVSPIEA